MSDGELSMVNLGCGTRLHAQWVNIDMFPTAPGVRVANFIDDGVPLPDRSASCVYHSHVLEHLPLPVARRFLGECFRVLAPGGIIRVVVPDFEQSARDYVEVLDRRRRGEDLRQEHRWLLIEMFDQMVRSEPGGEMVRMIVEETGKEHYIAERLGSYGDSLIEGVREAARHPPPPSKMTRVRGALEKLPGQWGRAFGEGLFRQRGEVHRWMYDELFLADVRKEVGFVDPRRMTHLRSDIPDWHNCRLDAESDDRPYKGTSLYLEARRPAE